jgi:hypothetical protein
MTVSVANVTYFLTWKQRTSTELLIGILITQQPGNSYGVTGIYLRDVTLRVVQYNYYSRSDLLKLIKCEHNKSLIVAQTPANKQFLVDSNVHKTKERQKNNCLSFIYEI